MVEYRIVCARTAEVLEQKVRSAIDDGWTPQGGVAVRSWVQSKQDERQYSPQAWQWYCHELMQTMTRQ